MENIIAWNKELRVDNEPTDNQHQVFVVWNKELSVGIEAIDDQHKVLVGLLNKLYEETIIKKDNLSHIDGILKELIQYTVIHFAVEESLYQIFNYPKYEIHKHQHNELKAEIVDFYNRFEPSTNTINLELLMFLRRWLETHILIEDKEGCQFLLKKRFKRSRSKYSWLGKISKCMHLNKNSIP